MKRSRCISFIGCVILVSAIACASPGAGQEKQMQRLATDLLLLTSAVEITVNRDAPSVGATEFEVLDLATREDPSLLEPFKDYKIRVLRQDQHVILLVCTMDGKRGLLEDAGCTPGMDEHLWASNKPCGFSISIEKACAK